jgi:xanthosine utilization system XapX-like protein
VESVGCAWYSWLHSKTATICYGNNRFSSQNFTGMKTGYIYSILSLIIISAPPLMVFLVLLPCNFSNGIFFKEMLWALIDNNLLSVATLIHSLTINQNQLLHTWTIRF